jgi:hypothetical protein
MEELIKISKEVVDWLFANRKTRDDAIAILRKGQNIPVSGNYKIQIERLTPEFKNLIISYTYPREIPDYQLPYFINQYRLTLTAPPNTPDINETGIILEAYRGRVYVNFIRLLFHGFIKNEDGTENLNKVIKTVPQDFSSFKGCPICGKREQVEYFGSRGNIPFLLCPHCLFNLLTASRILDVFEPGFITNLGYLSWKKNAAIA